ncbi:MAG TPA: hypothetical protein VG144_05760 [Gaiellaceae bacterium]|nr:hypothetical protein [Gaiellaceae bacterium]
MRPLLLAVALAALAGCGGSPEGPLLAPPAEPRTIELGWMERHRDAAFTFRVDRLVVAEDGWSVTVSTTNDSLLPYRPDAQSVALVLLDSGSQAEVQRLTGNLRHAPPALKPVRASPPPPATLRPGATWRTTVSGTEVLRAGSFVRVLFGPFPSVERFRTEAQEIQWVTEHFVRL